MLINQNMTGMLLGACSGYGPPLPRASEILKPVNTFSEAVLCQPPPPRPPLDGFCRQKRGQGGWAGGGRGWDGAGGWRGDWDGAHM